MFLDILLAILIIAVIALHRLLQEILVLTREIHTVAWERRDIPEVLERNWDQADVAAAEAFDAAWAHNWEVAEWEQAQEQVQDFGDADEDTVNDA